MKIDKAAAPFVAGALVPAAVLAGSKRYGWAAGFAALGAFFAYFFRDPERVVPQDEGLVVSPADGKVMIAGPSDGRWSPPGEWQQITIFLSPMDVHINRTPVDGVVSSVAYRPGTFLPAYKEDASGNELNEIWLDHHGEPVVVRQIVGVLARRIVCRVAEGQRLQRGERIGLMKFGSRMDVFLPSRAELVVQVGQQVVAGESVLARLHPQGEGW
ncbi:MAG TPA: phosphatidylserine decarboxylase [Vicinamibacterales bacterium]|jgi:phosphatidylserine decarboxylase